MRAREFVKEAGPSLADQLRKAIAVQQGTPMGQNTDTNQTKTGVGTQGSAGTVAPTQASAQQTPAGGTQTPQNGTKQPGVFGSFVSGLTGGKADSLKGLAGVAAAKTLQGAGLGNTADAIGQTMNPNQQMNTQQMIQQLKPGQTLDHPELGKIKINKVGPQGLELDTSQSPQLGVKKMNIDLKALAKVR
jgi:hypothetical protein